MNRIDRLTAILIHLQTKRIVKAEEIAERFEMSLRTVYRDVKALMEAGVPIGSEAGKGYFIVDGYHLPPVMFTQDEANSMLLAGKLVEKMTDKSIRQAFGSALHKIKAVLTEDGKDNLEDLHAHIEVRPMVQEEEDPSNSYLTDIQRAVINKVVVRLDYVSISEESSTREVEPIGLFYYGAAWHLIAWCRLRNGYRDFRTDRIREFKFTTIKFDSRNLLSLQEYLSTVVLGNREVHKVSILIDPAIARYFKQSKYLHGYVSEEPADERIRMHFLVGCFHSFARWVLTMGNRVEIESPEEARDVLVNLVEQLSAHYLRQSVER